MLAHSGAGKKKKKKRKEEISQIKSGKLYKSGKFLQKPPSEMWGGSKAFSADILFNDQREEVVYCAHTHINLYHPQTITMPSLLRWKSSDTPGLHKVAKMSVSLNKNGLSKCVHHWAFQRVTKPCRATHCTSTFTATVCGNGTEVTLFHLSLLIKGSFTSLPLLNPQSSSCCVSVFCPLPPPLTVPTLSHKAVLTYIYNLAIDTTSCCTIPLSSSGIDWQLQRESFIVWCSSYKPKDHLKTTPY